ncbi:helix-turn-helix domain-containing protein [Shimazuella kribbensis]|uniref:helix-turn-helix domain-containing protein n=1 Tax=Shimazuella kribbensis TaxID=139808 RepID=UPI0003F7FB25|nr:helix-turn-helix transcriptional regulator [Shimazuella kribbensis]
MISGSRTEAETKVSSLFGENLGHLRLHREMSQAKCVELIWELEIPFSQTRFSLLERNVQQVKKMQPANRLSSVSFSVDLLMAVAKVFQIPPEWFLTEHPNISEALQQEFGVLYSDMSPKPKNFYSRVVGQRLRYLREDRGWTMEQLAEKVRKKGFRMSFSRIGAFGSGYKNPSMTVDQLVVQGCKLGTMKSV